MKYERRLQTAIKKVRDDLRHNRFLHTEEGSQPVIGERYQGSFVCFWEKEKNGWKGRCFGVHNLAAGQLKGQAPTAKASCVHSANSDSQEKAPNVSPRYPVCSH
jgi:hypothetical protein